MAHTLGGWGQPEAAQATVHASAQAQVAKVPGGQKAPRAQAGQGQHRASKAPAAKQEQGAPKAQAIKVDLGAVKPGDRCRGRAAKAGFTSAKAAPAKAATSLKVTAGGRVTKAGGKRSSKASTVKQPVAAGAGAEAAAKEGRAEGVVHRKTKSPDKSQCQAAQRRGPTPGAGRQTLQGPVRGRSTTTAMGERGTEQGALPAPAGLRIAASTKRKAEAAGATPLGPRQKQACRRMGASSSRAGAASPKAADRQLATAAAATGGAAVALSGAGIAGRAAGLSEARSDVITLRETPFAGVKVPTTAEQTKLIANATFSPEEEHAEQMLFKQAAVAVTVSIRRRRRQLLALIGRRKSVQECELRRVLGNTPDTSKALRLALQLGELQRSGHGGRADPFRWDRTFKSKLSRTQQGSGAHPSASQSTAAGGTNGTRAGEDVLASEHSTAEPAGGTRASEGAAASQGGITALPRDGMNSTG